jgi:pyruvate/2-oxoglutarate dehydrogenase complex dihydrolipoamide dehydrogenase (E3) component
MHLVKARAHEFGVRGVDTHAITFDLAAAVARKDAIIRGIIDGIYKALNTNKKITFITGRAELTSPVDIRVDGNNFSADKIILAVGSQPALTDIPGLEETGYITNYEALSLEKLPASMIVIGAGYEGAEFAQMYSRFGTKVTLLGRAPRVMPGAEPELSERLGEILRWEDVDLHTSTEALRAGIQNGQRFVIARSGDAELRFEAEVILKVTGRIARLTGLGLEQAGVQVAGDFVKADEQLRTTAANIWSIGDANGGYMFTHRASYDGPNAALNAVRGLDKTIDYRVVPWAVFTEPALASVGMTEEQARRAGYQVKVGKALFAHSGRAKAIGQTEGLVKLVADGRTGVLLGGHILGPHADILIHEVVAAMYNHGTGEAIAKSIHIHPTLPEVLKSAAKAV